ncbi:hypothetical protein DUNSADRAFT_14797 [Dunaliella salina]|uniref:Uncharacterized protein n=1 Tax=Dunaliella salina TaxID=3046 RepID=A0ABQ7G6R8_DUNSA|nr:hypothetical protein DUNSADRAFT_14797 [Dunaliella salina]|eukprot:KAF5830275.1 hypothetical protein DUNSADRAFT_14797 [Dunaliella salina]
MTRVRSSLGRPSPCSCLRLDQLAGRTAKPASVAHLTVLCSGCCQKDLVCDSSLCSPSPEKGVAPLNSAPADAAAAAVHSSTDGHHISDSSHKDSSTFNITSTYAYSKSSAFPAASFGGATHPMHSRKRARSSSPPDLSPTHPQQSHARQPPQWQHHCPDNRFPLQEQHLPSWPMPQPAVPASSGAYWPSPMFWSSSSGYQALPSAPSDSRAPGTFLGHEVPAAGGDSRAPGTFLGADSKDHGMLVGEDGGMQGMPARDRSRVLGFCGEEYSRVQGLRGENGSRAGRPHAEANSGAQELWGVCDSRVQGVLEGEEDSNERSPVSIAPGSIPPESIPPESIPPGSIPPGSIPPGSIPCPVPVTLQPLHMPHTQPQLRPYPSSRPSYPPDALQLAPTLPPQPCAQTPLVQGDSSRSPPLCLHRDPPWQYPQQSLPYRSARPLHLPYGPPHTKSSHYAPPLTSSCHLLPSQPARHLPATAAPHVGEGHAAAPLLGKKQAATPSVSKPAAPFVGEPAVPFLGKPMPRPAPPGKPSTGKGCGFPPQAAPQHRGNKWSPQRAKGDAAASDANQQLSAGAGRGQPPKKAANKAPVGPNAGQAAAAAAAAAHTDHPYPGLQQTKGASSQHSPRSKPHALNKKAKRQRAPHAPNKKVNSTAHTNGGVPPKPAAKFGSKHGPPASAACTGTASGSHAPGGHATVAPGVGSSHHGNHHQPKRQRKTYAQGVS